MMPAREINRAVSLGQLLEGIVDLRQDAECYIEGVSLDSLNCQSGYLFIAVQGYRQHGLFFAEQAVKNGAVALVYESNEDGPETDVELEVQRLQQTVSIPLIAIENLKQYVGVIAERFYGNPSQHMTMIGITGTNGKTSCAQFIANAIGATSICGVLGTIGNGIYGQLAQSSHTTPDAVSLHALLDSFYQQGASTTVMEVSSHGLVQGRVAGVSFDVAVFTNLSRDHLDYHGDMAQYGQAKSLLFQMPSVKHVVINADDEFGARLLQELTDEVEKIAFGIDYVPETSGAQKSKCLRSVRATDINQSPQGLRFRINSDWGELVIGSPLLGRFNVRNMLAVFGVLMATGMPLEEAASRIENLQTISGRMERLGGTDTEPLVVVDYAHTPDALENVLKALSEHVTGVGEKHGRLICLFGCGGDRDRGKRSEMARIAETYADYIVVTNDNPRHEQPQAIVADISKGFSTESTHEVILDRSMAIAQVIMEAACIDVVLIAGKGHEDYQIIGETKYPYVGDVSVASQALAQRVSTGRSL